MHSVALFQQQDVARVQRRAQVRLHLEVEPHDIAIEGEKIQPLGAAAEPALFQGEASVLARGGNDPFNRFLLVEEHVGRGNAEPRREDDAEGDTGGGRNARIANGPILPIGEFHVGSEWIQRLKGVPSNAGARKSEADATGRHLADARAAGRGCRLHLEDAPHAPEWRGALFGGGLVVKPLDCEIRRAELVDEDVGKPSATAAAARDWPDVHG